MKYIKMFSISDNHIGNSVVESGIMKDDIINYLTDNIKLINECDILTITGDYTDKLLYTNSKEYYDALSVLQDIATLCVRTNTTFIYLVGTPWHEMDQMENMLKLVSRQNEDFKYYYFPKMDIVRLEEFDMDLMVVPDNSAKTDDLLFSKAKSLLRKHNLTKVDFMLTHTEYEEAVVYPTDGVKSTALWSSMVRYYIINGHIHNHSANDKVITVGALDFITHGDTEVKGGVYIQVRNEVPEYKFIPTNHFTSFIDIDATAMDSSNLLTTINKHILHHNKRGRPYHIRVIFEDSKDTILKSLEEENPLLRLKTMSKRKKKSIEVKKKETTTINTFSIDANNITDLLLSKVGSYVDRDIFEEELKRVL